jgi:hypothetical protein
MESAVPSATPSHRKRMAIWCLLVLASILLFVSAGVLLFFEPAHDPTSLEPQQHSLPLTK